MINRYKLKDVLALYAILRVRYISDKEAARWRSEEFRR